MNNVGMGLMPLNMTYQTPAWQRKAQRLASKQSAAPTRMGEWGKAREQYLDAVDTRALAYQDLGLRKQAADSAMDYKNQVLGLNRADWESERDYKTSTQGLARQELINADQYRLAKNWLDTRGVKDQEQALKWSVPLGAATSIYAGYQGKKLADRQAAINESLQKDMADLRKELYGI